jgi:dihydrofolate synthase/folylpolyglutamate synthase
MTVGLSFDYFAKQEIDVAVIEVGMGGRLDSTNIIKPLVSVITNIGLDHTLFLGNTLEAIANEKAGIIKPNTPVIVGEYNDKTKGVFLAKAKDCKADIYFASDLITKEYPSDLLGDYQQQNKKTAIQTIRVLKPHFSVSEENLKDGLLNVVKNTGLLGRWQQIHSNPKVICDTAHNSHGLKIVLNQIQKEEFDNLFFVLGFVNDKDLDDVLPLFPKKAKYFFSKPNIFRGLDAKILQEKATNFGLTGNIYSSITEAYKEALKLSSQNDFIYIGGSTFVVAEIL